MESPKSSLNNTFQDNTEIQGLLKQIEDAKTELQLTKDEVEQVNKDVNKCREEMDRRMMMMVQMDEGLWNSLLELDALMQEKKSLAGQLEELTLSSTVESKQALLRSLQEEESSLLEQECNLKLKHEQLRKALAEASSNMKEVSQGENLVKPDTSSQSKSTEKPVKKRRERK
ncbi:BICD family-like cargo adapter 1 [Chanodichthys erythropterus]|uniref:BICD family-like cargo adapter 1 n=1 Tax=Chanodichthys erythropterus TaxID=933992 RepID=UPI00351EC477